MMRLHFAARGPLLEETKVTVPQRTLRIGNDHVRRKDRNAASTSSSLALPFRSASSMPVAPLASRGRRQCGAPQCPARTQQAPVILLRPSLHLLKQSFRHWCHTGSLYYIGITVLAPSIPSFQKMPGCSTALRPKAWVTSAPRRNARKASAPGEMSPSVSPRER
jgi:hypothetical protein